MTATHAVNRDEDDKGGREFDQGRVEEVQVDVAPGEAHVHDETLVEDRAREPEQRGELRSSRAPGAGP